ncbi:MAG: LysR family transcriptional regulator [Bryobacterales bacterium]|nr:LysR family transcriptional regulator [Bryobacterales bacterium]
MSHPDFNLLATLDVLLTESNVSRAAKRLRLSPSAVSRALARLRETMGDPLLVRAGRGLVPTPRAIELREIVSRLVPTVEAVLRPVEKLNLKTLRRTFTLRSSEGFVESFGPELIARVEVEAPGIRLHFLQKPDKESKPLREGIVDLETGVVEDTTSPEIRAKALFRDRYVGVVRPGHALSEGEITPARYAAGRHILVSRSGFDKGPIDGSLESVGLEREIVTSVGGFSTALALARSSDLIATVPEWHTRGIRGDLFTFPLPFRTQEFAVSLLWHPRMEADQAHGWLRGCISDICAKPPGG